ncbi:fimbrial subunit [Bordetella trematum]|uniref:fimbrial protein n=1 Tax=Bordetella trematum TaxID=123899 RepID=UPI0007964789|nr:fimbrial protein [Bordetella trematum]QIM70465.1 fimbrial protein [Bordetella trematum]SAI32496.1 fimbrial subunit [Bordetella trematum]
MNTPPLFPNAFAWPVRLACLSLSLACAPAFAVDGTITINGEIISSTCKINGQTPPSDLLVTLPKISTSALKKKGDFAGATPFALVLSECPATLTGEVKAHFEPGVTTAYEDGNLYAYTTSTAKEKASTIPAGQASQGKADNVQIQLTNTDGSVIHLGATDSKAAGAMLTGSDTKGATLRYLARYYKSGDSAIAAGKLYTYVQYSIVYP